MARKFKLIFLLSLTLLMILGTTSFARIEMTSGDADQILDYYQENLDTILQGDSIMGSIKENLSQVDRQAFADIFNSYFYDTNGFIDLYSGDYDFNNVTCFAYYYKTGSISSPKYYIRIFFLLSNNTYSEDLDYLYYETKTNETSVNKISFGGWNGTEVGSLPCLHIELLNGYTVNKSVITEYAYYNHDIRTTDHPEVEGTKVNIKSLLGLSPSQVVYYKPYGATEPTPYFLANTIDLRKNLPEIPDTPESGDTESGDITESGDTGGGTVTPSGDTGSGTTNEKLDNINNQLENTNNKLDNISGELSNINNNLTTVPDISGTTIGSGDIEDALNFDFAEDPYSNFWYELTTGLGDALTGNNRSIKIDFRNKSYNINLDDFSLQVPQFLKSFLAIISTVLVVWQMIRYVKIIIDKISSGNMDEVLAMNEEERNCRLILRGDIFVRSFI